MGHRSASHADKNDRETHPIIRRLVGHNEDTLRQLCRREDPDSPEKLRVLLMKQIMHVPHKDVPPTVDVGDVVEETVLYFMPEEQGRNSIQSRKVSQTLSPKMFQTL